MQLTHTHDVLNQPLTVTGLFPDPWSLDTDRQPHQKSQFLMPDDSLSMKKVVVFVDCLDSEVICIVDW